nr:MAG TPA: hypothetical protein [Crassvirales sp.]
MQSLFDIHSDSRTSYCNQVFHLLKILALYLFWSYVEIHLLLHHPNKPILSNLDLLYLNTIEYNLDLV